MLAQLDGTVRDVLAGGRLGTPVFVRWIAHLPRQQLKPALATMLAAAQSWLGAPPLRLYAQEGRGGVDITATVLYAGGQTALVTAAQTAEGEPAGADLTLLGNQGAAYQEAFPWPAGVLAPSVADLKAALTQAVERSLAAGMPVEWEGDAHV